MRIFAALLIVGTGLSLPCTAGLFSRGCPHCGCPQLKKVCRVVPDVKKVPETKFVVACEEICLPGRSHCTERVVADQCAPGGQRCETVREPSCDRIVTKKTLKKVTTTVDKPGWKCVVETVCSQCGNACGPSLCGK